MRKITEHVANPVNDRLQIAVLDKPGAGGASHVYEITATMPDGVSPAPEFEPVIVRFQNGPIAEADVNGVTQEALLAIVADRLRSFQAGPYPCQENSYALAHVDKALRALKERTIDRMARGVEGITKP